MEIMFVLVVCCTNLVEHMQIIIIIFFNQAC